jgi:hypothetical protein
MNVLNVLVLNLLTLTHSHAANLALFATWSSLIHPPGIATWPNRPGCDIGIRRVLWPLKVVSSVLLSRHPCILALTPCFPTRRLFSQKFPRRSRKLQGY